MIWRYASACGLAVEACDVRLAGGRRMRFCASGLVVLDRRDLWRVQGVRDGNGSLAKSIWAAGLLTAVTNPEPKAPA